jgi:hypothetical protein
MPSEKQNSKSSPSRGFGEAIQDLLNRAREGASDLLGLLNPTPRPALQPVPVRNQPGRARRSPNRR